MPGLSHLRLCPNVGTCAGSALTTFNKGGMDLDPKVIAHRSPKTQGDMLVNPAAYDEFCAKGQLHDQVCLAALCLNI